MARPRKIDPDWVAQAQVAAARAGDVEELRMARAVLLPALAQLTLKLPGQGAWGWPRDGGSAAEAVPATKDRSQATGPALGRTATGANDTGRRAGFGSDTKNQQVAPDQCGYGVRFPPGPPKFLRTKSGHF